MEVGVGSGVCEGGDGGGCWRWGVQGWVMEVGCARVGGGVGVGVGCVRVCGYWSYVSSTQWSNG